MTGCSVTQLFSSLVYSESNTLLFLPLCTVINIHVYVSIQPLSLFTLKVGPAIKGTGELEITYNTYNSLNIVP